MNRTMVERRKTRIVLAGSRMTHSVPAKTKQNGTSHSWTFFSNHAHVLLCLHQSRNSTLRDVALVVGITERAVQKIVAELEAADVLSREKVGRCNHYSINRSARMRHSIEAHRTVGDLMSFIGKGP